ncbi:MAG: hypothetical protein AAB437_04835, partial [Patescibacteria group bacterium]
KNNGNSYLWQVPVAVKAEGLTVSKGKFEIPVLAPLEKKSITFDYFTKDKNKKIQGKLIIKVMEKQLLEQKINVIPLVYTSVIKIFAVLLGLSVLFLIYRLLTKMKHHDH